MISSGEGIEFREESLEEILKVGEAEDLFEENHKETSWDPDLDLDPDYQKYIRIENLGKLKFFTIRTKEGVLVGYSCFFIGYDSRFKTKVRAVQDMTFISKQYRRKFPGSGLAFIKFCDERLRKAGANYIWRQATDKHDISAIYNRLGYKFMEYVYAKEL